jgi:hypothetical protein
MESKRLNETADEEYDNFCIYGVGGVGKTLFSATYGDRTAILSIGGGLRSLKSPLYRSKFGYNPIIIELNEEAISSKGKPGELFDHVCDGLDKLLERKDEYDVIVLDDQSSLNRAAKIKGMEMNKSPSIISAMSKGQYPTVEVSDYNYEQSLLTWFFDTYTKIFKREKKFFIITAHERIIFKKRTGKDIGNPEPEVHKYQPDVSGKDAWCPGTYMGFFDNVWRMTMDKGIKDKGQYLFRNRIQTLPTLQLNVKTRIGGVFSDELIDPTLLDVITHIKESSQQPYIKPLYKGSKNA